MASGTPPVDLDDPAQQALLLTAARRSAARETTDPHLAEEAAGHAVTELWRLPRDRRPPAEEWRGWVKLAARRYAARADQKAKRNVPDEHALQAILDGVDKAGRARRLSSVAAEVHDLRVCFEQLAERDRTLLFDRYVRGHSAEEIAHHLNMNVGVVNNRLTAAKKRLRACLAGTSAERNSTG